MESIKRARKRSGLSLTDVSERTGLYREVIARAERRTRTCVQRPSRRSRRRSASPCASCSR
jgi:transcriptional regulator with XRE-family HTH domain